MRQLNFVLATDSKIVSINSLYGAKIGWKAGRPFPQLYRSAAAMRFEREVREQLLALHLDAEWVNWFKTTKQFSMTVNFILRTGVSRRDVSNCDKALIDTITRFIKYDLGCEDFDDSLFTDVHFYKSTIPQGQKEYCCVQIKESMHDMRFDVIPKPEKLWFWEGCEDKPALPKIPKRRKKGEIYLEEVSKEQANTFLYILTPNTKLTPELFFKIAEDKNAVLNGTQGFFYLGVMGQKEDWKEEQLEQLNFLISEVNNAHEIYSGVVYQKLENINEVLDWLQQ